MTSALPDLPTADLVTARGAVVLADRPVVGLSRALADTAARCARQGLQLQVVTPSRSRLTWPLEELLSADDACWVVQDAEGPAVDGLRRHALAWDGEVFAPGGATAPGAGSGDGGDSGGAVVDVTALHQPRADLLLGGLLETVLDTLTGERPTGWGVAEPAASRWDRGELTRLCRDRAPARTQLVAVGPYDVVAERGTVATLTVRRVPAGLLERVRVFVGSAVPPGPQVLDGLAEGLAAHPVRSALVGLRAGRNDGTVTAHGTRLVLPVGLLVGREGLAGDTAPDGVVLVGSGASRAGWVRLDPADPEALPGALRRLAPGSAGAL